MKRSNRRAGYTILELDIVDFELYDWVGNINLVIIAAYRASFVLQYFCISFAIMCIDCVLLPWRSREYLDSVV